MADYLLDTNILKYWYDDRCVEHAKVLARLTTVRQPDPTSGYISHLFISATTAGEIEYGHRVIVNRDIAKQAAFTRFVRAECPVSLEVTDHVSEQYGELRAWLFNNCSPKARRAKRAEELIDPTTARELGVDENDIWITATALTHNLVLVTNDSKGNFGRLCGAFSTVLKVEYWTR